MKKKLNITKAMLYTILGENFLTVGHELAHYLPSIPRNVRIMNSVMNGKIPGECVNYARIQSDFLENFYDLGHTLNNEDPFEIFQGLFELLTFKKRNEDDFYGQFIPTSFNSLDYYESQGLDFTEFTTENSENFLEEFNELKQSFDAITEKYASSKLEELLIMSAGPLFNISLDAYLLRSGAKQLMEKKSLAGLTKLCLGVFDSVIINTYALMDSLNVVQGDYNTISQILNIPVPLIALTQTVVYSIIYASTIHECKKVKSRKEIIKALDKDWISKKDIISASKLDNVKKILKKTPIKTLKNLSLYILLGKTEQYAPIINYFKKLPESDSKKINNLRKKIAKNPENLFENINFDQLLLKYNIFKPIKELNKKGLNQLKYLSEILNISTNSAYNLLIEYYEGKDLNQILKRI